MARRFILLLLSLGLSVYVSAQLNWAPDDAVWHYKYDGMCFYGYTEITVDGDSLIQNIPCRRMQISSHVVQACAGNLCCIEINQSTEFTYADADRVYRWNGADFDVLFDFTYEVGDTHSLPALLECDPGTSVVTETGNLVLNGHNLRYYDVEMVGFDDVYQEGRVIEHIGMIGYGYLFPQPGCIIDFGGSSDFRCYKDSQFGEYREYLGDCDFIISVDELAFAGRTVVYPNPVNDVLYIDAQRASSTYVLTDSKGTVVGNGALSMGSSPIDVSAFAPGVYFMTVEFTNGDRLVRRIVKG